MKKYTLGLYEKAMPSVLGWDEKLISAREAGFDFVEISIDETDEKLDRLNMSKADRLKLIEQMTREMKNAAKLLEFEHAAYLRDRIQELQNMK